MKVIIGTSIVPTTTFIILFVELGILVTSFPQFVYAQTAENEIIEKALETVEKATTKGLSEITESVSNASKSITMSADNAQELSNNTASSQAFQQIKNIATDMGNASKATDSTNTSDKSTPHSQNEFKDSSRNWINGESDKLSFKYPSHWDVDISDSRFDNYELIFTDKVSNSSIRVSDEALSSANKILYRNNTERYSNTYMMQHSPLSTDSSKIDTYPKGKVSIAGLPAYSELYLDQGNAILISLAFQEGNDRHYTVVSRSPSSNYDNLEPTMLEIIKSITPKTIQKQSDQEVEILSNNTNSDDLGDKKGIEQVKKEDSLKKESLLLSNKTESNNTSNESLIIEQQQQENGSLTQTSNIYEGIGIKINYFDPWEMIIQSDDPSCLYMCSIILSTLDHGATIIIIQDKFDSPEIKNKCKCDTLLEYVKYIYKDKISKQEGFVFINDNQTTLTDDNIPAIQMEYEKKGRSTNFETLETKNIIEKSYEILTKAPNSFYRIIFSADKNEQYSKYIEDLKKMLNSLEFVSTINETINKPKQPSFMASEKSNESISPSISDNEYLEGLSSELMKALDKSFDKLPESKSNELTISSHNSYINSIGHMHVIGEVQSNTPNVIQYVKVTGTFYDNNNKVVGTSFTYTDPKDLAPGENAPFDLILTDASIPIDQIEKYTLNVSGQ
jgi:SLAP domain-containing protein